MSQWNTPGAWSGGRDRAQTGASWPVYGKQFLVRNNSTTKTETIKVIYII